MPYADLEQTFLSETHLKLNTWTRVRRTYRGHLLSFHLKQISLQKLIYDKVHAKVTIGVPQWDQGEGHGTIEFFFS